MHAFLFLFTLLFGVLPAQAQPAASRVKIQWLGHAAFQIISLVARCCSWTPTSRATPTRMALIQEFYRPTILLLGVGGGAFGQDAATARDAARKYFKPKVIIPMHFGEQPFHLATEPEVRAVFRGDKRVQLLQPGEVRFC